MDNNLNKNNNIFRIINNKKILIIIGVIILCVVLCFLFFNKDSQIMVTDGDRFKSEYEKYNNEEIGDGNKYIDITINCGDKIKYIKEDDVLDILNNSGYAVIYFGYPTCVFCRPAVEVLCNTVKNTELETIYYVDSKNELDSSLTDIMWEEFIIEQNGIKNINAPLVLFVAKGNIVSYNVGTVSSYSNPYIPMNQAQIDGLSFIYQHGIQDVIYSMALNNVN